LLGRLVGDHVAIEDFSGASFITGRSAPAPPQFSGALTVDGLIGIGQLPKPFGHRRLEALALKQAASAVNLTSS